MGIDHNAAICPFQDDTNVNAFENPQICLLTVPSPTTRLSDCTHHLTSIVLIDYSTHVHCFIFCTVLCFVNNG